MSDWTVYGPGGPPYRWLNHRDPLDWVADPETTAVLTAPDFGFPLVPAGPWQQGTPDEVTLYLAALAVIPGARYVGDVPGLPARLRATPGVVH
ncbi:hypothetical protein SIM91_02960 [Rhodococcus opacus]|uniref:hypothetical protein n=1 Tax=Rhodococcus opacus TaxID=37919 RepID=UPI0007CD585A|nr:hypothetical protein [Rhodococcus opacus]MDX5962303.1 hypothetical protein [Rhodococcus opacus]NKY76762.1 hypothetical protein [Rhodococcus opacus]CAG7642862.1 hypothetical protein E143388_08447 [Rhodococcus opacus]